MARPVTSSHINIHIILITVTRMEVTVQLILDGVTAVAESAVGLREPIFVRIVSHVCVPAEWAVLRQDKAEEEEG